MKAPTTDQLRDRIDSGRTGEKVAFPDPAAAPLGTDAEAGGAPPTEAERRLAEAADPVAPAPPPRIGLFPYLLATGLAGLALIALVLLARLGG